MKKFVYIMIIIIVIVLGICGVFVYQYEINFQAHLNELQIEENRILQEISTNTGLAPEWVAMREYIYCSYLQKGMSRSDVEYGLAKIGKLRNKDSVFYEESEIDFENPVIQNHLGPVMLKFSSSSPSATLERWSRSPDVATSDQLAGCEYEQEFYNSPDN